MSVQCSCWWWRWSATSSAWWSSAGAARWRKPLRMMTRNSRRRSLPPNLSRQRRHMIRGHMASWRRDTGECRSPASSPGRGWGREAASSQGVSLCTRTLLCGCSPSVEEFGSGKSNNKIDHEIVITSMNYDSMMNSRFLGNHQTLVYCFMRALQATESDISLDSFSFWKLKMLCSISNYRCDWKCLFTIKFVATRFSKLNSKLICFNDFFFY